MASELTRMWINQPSTLDPHHALHGNNVLARRVTVDAMEIFFLAGDEVSLQVGLNVVSPGWRPLTSATNEEVVEVVAGLHKALDRMIHKHDADSIEAEWLGHSNELYRKLTGRDVRQST